jgi:hypothetical protein
MKRFIFSAALAAVILVPLEPLAASVAAAVVAAARARPRTHLRP